MELFLPITLAREQMLDTKNKNTAKLLILNLGILSMNLSFINCVGCLDTMTFPPTKAVLWLKCMSLQH